MNAFLFLLITGLISQVYCYGRVPKPKPKPEPEWEEPSQPTNEWSPPKPKPEWEQPSVPKNEWSPKPRPGLQRPPQPTNEWDQPKPKPKPEWQEPSNEWSQQKPKPEWQQQPRPEWGPPVPESMCKKILPNLKEIETTPIVETTETYDSLFPCDSNSKFKALTYVTVTNNSRITCNGVVLTFLDDFYDAVLPANGYEGEIKERLILKNYTQIDSYSNGNMNYMECGTIVGGRCSGDTLVGTGIYQAIDQSGCCKHGSPGNVGIFRLIEIKGRCASKCSLGRSTHLFNPTVSNKG